MYIVIEIQVNSDDTVGTLVTTYTSINEAQSKYHTILAAAAISDVYKHGAVILTADAAIIASQSYVHEESNEEVSL